ncbi:hypothetical protein [Streptosporangium sp. NPDC051022]|uniref:hypothetical protein n=1 Tax=Streptosporangium sp. NPDC051022 TaxID=3155752 RepID=UPI00342229A2
MALTADEQQSTVDHILRGILGRVFQFLVLLGRGDRAKAAEIVVLRHQVRECASRLPIYGECHLRRVLQAYERHHNGRGQVRPGEPSVLVPQAVPVC